MGIKITGLDEIRRNLAALASRAQRLDGVHKVKLQDVFTSDFMRRFTDFLTFEEMFTSGEFRIRSQEDFDALPVETLDTFVAERTLFASWAEMKEKALAEWVGTKLGLD